MRPRAPGKASGSYHFAEIPRPLAVPVLVVKHDRLGNIDNVSDDCDDEATQGTQDPPLGGIEGRVHAAPEVLPAPQRLDPVSVGDTVVHPVGRGELVVPHALVGVY